MAINKIDGNMLSDNLARDNDLSIETNLLYVDVANSRIGVNTATPTQSLQVDNITINGSQIRSTSGDLDLGAVGDIAISGGSADYVLTTDGAGGLTWSSIDSLVSTGTTGMSVTLGTPTDTSLYPEGAINDWTTSTYVTDAIDDLNELATNMINDTAVANIDFTGDNLVGGAGMVTTLTITADGNPTRYTINWGDGNTTTGTTDSTPTHTYATNTGSPFDVTVTAYNHNGSGAGSTISKTREDYITLYTADPVVSFSAYAAATGGSPITQWDDGDTIYFENTTTNTSGATVQYTWDWGDGSTDSVVSSDSNPGGVGGGRISHTFTTSTEEEQTRTVTLTLDSHSTALPASIPTDDDSPFKIYDTHTPTVALSTTTGINEESTSGLPVTFTNNTESTIGSYADYGIQYLYTWGDGNTTTVNVGSGSNGDTGGTISHTYALSSANQASGTAVDYTGNLRVISDHTSSPFISSDFTVHVEPDVRANIAGTAVTVSDKTGDNIYDIYDGTDYNGNNRALVRVTNTSQNADDYVYDWGDTSTDDTLSEDGVSAGSIGATIDHDYSGETIGNYTLTFTANGTPDITAQTDSETIVFQLNSVPAAPDGVSSKTITLVDVAQGTSPKLAAGFADNSATSPLSAGDSINTTTARRYASGTIDTSVIANAYNGLSGTASAVINGTTQGSKTFSTALNENGTFTYLVVSDNRDANDTISAATYPTGFYQTFDAKITAPITAYTVGVNDQRIEHDATGNTNYTVVVRDDVTNTPTVDLTGATLAEGSVTYNYISGIPYYSSGSTLTLSGVEIYDWIGQAYQDTTTPFEITGGTNVDGTTDSVLSTQYKTYADLDGASSYLTGGIPNANTGKTSSTPYAIGDQTITLTSSSVTAAEKIKFRMTNVNGTGSYAELDQVIRVQTETPAGINEFIIPVSDSLGNGTYTDDGLRIADFIAATTDTPTFNGATNYYTNDPYTSTADPGMSGSQEASVLQGLLQHDTTDHSTNLPAGPDRSSDTGTQYFTFAFRRQVVANFDINITSSTGITGLWIAAPGTAIDSASTLNGWLDSSVQYAGAGVPGADTGNGGNGSNGCAFTAADIVPTGTSLNSSYTMTLGSENMSNATGNVVLVRIALASGETVSALSVGVAS